MTLSAVGRDDKTHSGKLARVMYFCPCEINHYPNFLAFKTLLEIRRSKQTGSLRGNPLCSGHCFGVGLYF